MPQEVAHIVEARPSVEKILRHLMPNVVPMDKIPAFTQARSRARRSFVALTAGKTS